jgi:hypothetical protein
MEIKEYFVEIMEDMKTPVIISDERVFKGDYYYDGSEILLSDGSFVEEGFKKVVALPSQIGWVYNEGPPHDHNRLWRDSRYLEDLHYDGFIEYIQKSQGKIYLLVQEICPNYDGSHINKDCSCKSGFIQVPVLYHDKVIMDSYEILKNSLGIFVY